MEDLLGTSRVLTTNAGVVCYDADFYPYGGERSYTNTCPQNYKFEGKERDTETGNDEFGARYYSNRFGRWLSADWSAVPEAVPYANLSNPQTLNLYSMVSDDPESFADLDGHEECFSNGACNSLRNPASADHWIVNGLSNTVSDLLSLDEVAKGSVDMVNAETTQGKVGTALGLVLLVAVNVVGGGEEGAAEKGIEAGAKDAAQIASRAEEIHGALDPIAQKMRTTAVAAVSAADGSASTMVASSERTLSKAQRSALQPGEVAVSGAKGVHAEQKILDAAKANGQTVERIATSPRPPCPTCRTNLQEAGVKTLPPKPGEDRLTNFKEHSKPPAVPKRGHAGGPS